MNEGMEGCSAGRQRGGGQGEPVRGGGLGRRKVGENTERKTTCLGKRNICVFFSPKTSEAANVYLKGERGYIQAAHWALSAAPKGSMRVGGVGVWTLEPAPCRNRPPPSWASLPGPPDARLPSLETSPSRPLPSLPPPLLAPQALSMQPPLPPPLRAQNPFLCSTLRCPDLLQGLAPVLLHSFIPHPFLQKLSAECLCLSNQNKLYRLRT